MKRKVHLLVLILSFFSLISIFANISEAADERDSLSRIVESTLIEEINSGEFLKKLQDIHGLTYQVGSRGSGVLEFQNLLIDNGYTSVGEADGKYGTKTANAVKSFQEAAKLNVTGKADIATQFKLLCLNNSLIRSGKVYAIKKHNYVIDFFVPGSGFYLGATDEAGNFIEGTYYYSAGMYYAGSYKDNHRYGKGTAYFPNGDVYIGQWKDDTMNGEGTYYYGGINSKEYYRGNMTNNKMNGKGTYYINGKKIAGKWSDNKPVRTK